VLQNLIHDFFTAVINFVFCVLPLRHWLTATVFQHVPLSPHLQAFWTFARHLATAAAAALVLEREGTPTASHAAATWLEYDPANARVHSRALKKVALGVRQAVLAW
jgi:hypothetical protein